MLEACDGGHDATGTASARGAEADYTSTVCIQRRRTTMRRNTGPGLVDTVYSIAIWVYVMPSRARWDGDTDHCNAFRLHCAAVSVQSTVHVPTTLYVALVCKAKRSSEVAEDYQSVQYRPRLD